MALKLTTFGEFVNRHSVMTPPDYWKKLLAEVDRMADQDGEWELMLTERAMGLLELAARYYQFTNKVVVEDCGATDGPPDHIYGRCNRPRGHTNVFLSLRDDYHCEMRDGKVWAEWRGPNASSATDESESSTASS